MLFSAIPSCAASRQCDAASDVRTCGTYDTTSLKSQECDFILQPTLRGVLYVYASTVPNRVSEIMVLSPTVTRRAGGVQNASASYLPRNARCVRLPCCENFLIY